MQVTPSFVMDSGNGNKARRAIEGGIIKDWEALESLLYYCIYEQLEWKMGAEGSFIAVEPALTSKSDRELLIQLMFEVFNVSSFFATDSAVASLYSIGKHTGLVVDFGYEKIDVIPVVEGMVQPSSAARIPCGGKDVDRYVSDVLKRKGIDMSEEDYERIKIEALRCIPKLSEEDSPLNASSPKLREMPSNLSPTEVTLPDGQKIELSYSECLEIGDRLLEPSKSGLDLPPLVEIMQAASMVTAVQGEREARRALADCVFLCGGGSQATGLGNRILTYARGLSHSVALPSFAAVPEYMPPQTAARAAWMGGAILAKALLADLKPNAPQQVVSKAEYEEYGPSAVHRKCS